MRKQGFDFFLASVLKNHSVVSDDFAAAGGRCFLPLLLLSLFLEFYSYMHAIWHGNNLKILKKIAYFAPKLRIINYHNYKYNRLMKKSALQKARASYQPKLPIVLTGAVKAVQRQKASAPCRRKIVRYDAMIFENRRSRGCSTRPTLQPKAIFR